MFVSFYLFLTTDVMKNKTNNIFTKTTLIKFKIFSSIDHNKSEINNNKLIHYQISKMFTIMFISHVLILHKNNQQKTTKPQKQYKEKI